MELRVLNYFLMAAREENITRAAQLLHITQPTLSRQLMQLEEELGVKLFERSNHHIILTNDGLLLKRRAQEIVSLAEKTKKEFLNEQQLIGELAIGSGEFKSFTLFSEIISMFSKQHPMVTFKLYSGNADSVKERLEKGILDIGLLLEPVDISRYEFIRIPQKELWGVLVHKSSELYEKNVVTPEDLEGMRMIISHQILVQNELKNWFGNVYDKMDVYATYNLLYNAAMMVRKNMGAALCIDLENNFDDLKFIPLSPKLEFSTVLVWKKNQIHSAITKSFIEFSKEYIKGISDNAL